MTGPFLPNYKQPRHGGQPRSGRRTGWRLAAASLLLATGFGLLSGLVRVDAAACPAPPADLGTDELTIDVPATATYTIWTRMQAPDTSHNSIDLQVDGTTCYNVGGGSFTATSWQSGSGNWIKYQDGSPSSVISMQLTQGSHTFKYIGTQAGVEVDRIILTSDASCTPTGVGDNCKSGDSTGPTVALTAPTDGQTVTGQFKFTATASDASGILSVQFLVDGNAVTTVANSPYEYSWNSAAVDNGPHTVAARAIDNANNTTTTSAVSVTVNNASPCSGNPSVPANLKAAGSTSAVALTWNASTPAANCSLQGYNVYRNGTLVASPTSNSFNDINLTPGTSYSYTVAAVDTSGHASAQTAAVSATTTPDTVAPSVPANLQTTLKTATSIALTWDASTDNVSIKDYVIYRNGTQVDIAATNSYTDTALAPSTAYTYTIKARDLAGNLSAASTPLSATTLAGSSANLGDLDGDHKVTLHDLSILLSHYGQTGVPVTQGDVNGNGKVELQDLSILLTNYGKSV